MSATATATGFIEAELADAIARGVRQCVVIGAEAPLPETLESAPEHAIQVFAVGEEQRPDLPATFVPTHFAVESLATALERSDFDKMKASVFVWLSGAYRTLESAVANLSFIASLPAESSVVLNYYAEQTPSGPAAGTALDALASRICAGGGTIKHLIQPQAVAAMLRGVGFRKIIDLAQEELSLPNAHLVSATV